MTTTQQIDLLYHEPQTRVRLQTLERALSYAFSAGDTSALFERALEHATTGASSFDVSCFENDLFVDEFLERCMASPTSAPRAKSSTSYVKRALCNPPVHLETTLFRQAILRELLENKALSERFEQVYVKACELRTLLEATDAGARYDINQRRVDVLRTFKAVIDNLASSFGSCQSALKRLAGFGQATQATRGYQNLSQLLDYEENMATLDLRVRVGIDGRLRAFDLLAFEENKSSVFHRGWLGRLWQRLWMFVRGYRVSEQEILMRLTDHVFDGLRVELLQLFQLLGDLDFYRAGLGLSRLATTQDLAVCLPEFATEGGLQLTALFNPFLVAEGVQVRCCDIRQRQADAMTIITGPNSGGKTRLLQALALCQLLGQAGLPIPARQGRLCWAPGMFVSIVHEVSAEQREGRLGMELLRIRRLFERATPGDVIVLDELCSGTNPSEGEEIFRLVIQLLSELRPQLWLTTHFLQFAQTLQSEATIAQLNFLQVELDEHEHPTFGFVPGVAKSSLAGQTAARLGVTWQELSALVADAKRRAKP